MNRVALTPDVAGKLGLKAGDTALVRASWGDIHPLYAAVVVGVFDESTLAALDAAAAVEPAEAGSYATGGVPSEAPEHYFAGWNGGCPLCDTRFSGTSRTVGRLLAHIVDAHLLVTLDPA